MQEGPTEDVVFTVDDTTLLANDTDIDGDPLSLVSVSNAQHGTVSYDAVSGKITFSPDTNYHGAASFDYSISDGNGGSDTATVNFTLQSVNDLPVITAPSAVQTNEDNSVNISYSVSDVEDDLLGLPLNVTASAQHGTVTLNGNGTMTYQPNANYNGADTVTIQAVDSNGGTTTNSVSVTVHPVNDAPVAVDDTQIGTVDHYVDVTPAHAAINAGKNINFTNAFTISESVKPTGAGIVFNKENEYEVAIEGDGSVRYAMRAANGSGWVWNDTGYNVALNSEHTLTHVYDGTNTTLKTYVDGALVATSTANVPTTLYSGYNATNNLLFGERGSNNQPLEGTLDDIRIYNTALSSAQVANIGNETGGLVAAYDFEGANPLADKSGNGNDATLQNGATVNITALNVTPITTNEDTPLTFDSTALTVNDTDVDGDTLSVSSVTPTANTHGTVVLNGDGTITYTPDLNYNGTAQFGYTVSDGNGGTDTATVTLNVQPVNDVPVIDHVTLKQPSRDALVFWDNMDQATATKSDLAQNGHNATQVGSTGIYTIADDTAINTGTYDQKTIAVSFTTGNVSAADPFQVIYEQGGAVNGYSVSVKGDHLYATVWGESYSTINPNYAIVDLGQINANTNYNVVMAHDDTAPGGGTLTAWLNGVQNPTVKTGVGKMGAHPGDVGIDGYKNDTIDPTNPTADVHGNGGAFQGTVHQVMSWNSAQSSVVGEANRYLNAIDDTSTQLDARLGGTIELFDVDASDVEDGTNLTYTLQNDYGGLFSVDAATGVVSVNADNLLLTNTYSLNVQAQDSQGAAASTTLSVNVKGSEVVHLNMNGNTNDTANAGVVTDNGQLHNGASVSNGDTLQLDGINDYLSFNSSNDINNGVHTQRSISLWLKTTDTTGTQFAYAEGGGIRSLQIYTENGIVKAKGYNDPNNENGWKAATPTILDSQTNIADNQWHHVVITDQGPSTDPLHGLDPNGFKLYVDNSIKASGTGGALYGHNPANIGSDYSGHQTFQGEIDGFRMYNDTLNASQVQQLYNELVNGQVIDGLVEGLHYKTESGITGYTDQNGHFNYHRGEKVTFSVGGVEIGHIDTNHINDGKVFLQDIAQVDRTNLHDSYVENMAVLLQSLDADGNPDNGITIDHSLQLDLKDESIDIAALSEKDLHQIITSTGHQEVDKTSAMEHVQHMLEKYTHVNANDIAQNTSDSDIAQTDVSKDTSVTAAETSEDPEKDMTSETSGELTKENSGMDEGAHEDTQESSTSEHETVMTETNQTASLTEESTQQTEEPAQKDRLFSEEKSDTVEDTIPASSQKPTLTLDDVTEVNPDAQSADALLPPTSDHPIQNTEASHASEGSIDTAGIQDPTVVVSVDDQTVPAAA